MTTAGSLAARAVIHAVSLDRERRTSGPVIAAAVRSAMARAREIRATSLAFPALGTGVGGFPLDEAARITVQAVRDELPCVSYHRPRDLRVARQGRLRCLRRGPGGPADVDRSACLRDARRLGVTTPLEPTEEQRDELVEQVAREIQLRGLTGPAVHFLEASRPYRPLGANAMLFFDPVLRGLFGGELSSATEIMADDAGIELLIARLEEYDDEATWDA